MAGTCKLRSCVDLLTVLMMLPGDSLELLLACQKVVLACKAYSVKEARLVSLLAHKFTNDNISL